MNMLTAKEFVLNQNDGYLAGDYTPNEVYRIMIGFAKMHVKAALKAASERVEVEEFYIFGTTEDEDMLSDISLDALRCNININSILNAYPLTNIK